MTTTTTTAPAPVSTHALTVRAVRAADAVLQHVRLGPFSPRLRPTTVAMAAALYRRQHRRVRFICGLMMERACRLAEELLRPDGTLPAGVIPWHHRPYPRGRRLTVELLQDLGRALEAVGYFAQADPLPPPRVSKPR
jgi:hypothetical protein